MASFDNASSIPAPGYQKNKLLIHKEIYLSKRVKLLTNTFQQLFCISIPFIDLQFSPIKEHIWDLVTSLNLE